MGRFSTKYWGMEVQLDLYECDPRLIRDADAIREYVIKLCDLIKMIRYGKCMVVHFGEDPRVAGYSMFQLIETSNISAHFANETNAIYLNVFSCKQFNPDDVKNFTKQFFKSEKVKMKINYRK